jgi:hypothetical protein
MGYLPWMVLISEGLMGACVSDNSRTGDMVHGATWGCGKWRGQA